MIPKGTGNAEGMYNNNRFADRDRLTLLLSLILPCQILVKQNHNMEWLFMSLKPDGSPIDIGLASSCILDQKSEKSK